MNIVPRQTSHPLTNEEEINLFLQWKMDNVMGKVRSCYSDKLKTKYSAKVRTVTKNDKTIMALSFMRMKKKDLELCLSKTPRFLKTSMVNTRLLMM